MKNNHRHPAVLSLLLVAMAAAGIMTKSTRAMVESPNDSSTTTGIIHQDTAPTKADIEPRWKRLDVRGTLPEARRSHTMAYDAARVKIVLFGGYSSVNGELGDTWIWNGRKWKEKDVTGPEPREGHGMVYDSVRGNVILFGGYSSGYLGDTWIWDGSEWQELEITGPAPRAWFAFAFDRERGVAVLYGGSGSDFHSDTWEFDGSSWEMVADGGFLPPDDQPSHYSGASLAFDLKRKVSVMMSGEVYPGRGGFISDDTWEWDGLQWSKVEVDTRPPRSDDRRLAFDSSRNITILFGGQVGVWHGSQLTFEGTAHTWEFDGLAWARRDLLFSGPAGKKELKRGRHAVAFDENRGRLVVFGGSGENGYLNDTWIYGAGVDDHGNSQADSTKITIPSEIPAELEYGSDKDFFKFRARAGTMYVFTTSGTTDTKLQLLDRAGEMISANKDGGKDSNARIRLRIETGGKYYLVVSGQGKTVTGAYTLNTSKK